MTSAGFELHLKHSVEAGRTGPSRADKQQDDVVSDEERLVAQVHSRPITQKKKAAAV